MLLGTWPDETYNLTIMVNASWSSLRRSTVQQQHRSYGSLPNAGIYCTWLLVVSSVHLSMALTVIRRGYCHWNTIFLVWFESSLVEFFDRVTKFGELWPACSLQLPFEALTQPDLAILLFMYLYTLQASIIASLWFPLYSAPPTVI